MKPTDVKLVPAEGVELDLWDWVLTEDVKLEPSVNPASDKRLFCVHFFG